MPPALGEVLQIVEKRMFYFFSINFRSRRTSIKTRPSSTQTADKKIITYRSNGISGVPPISVPGTGLGNLGPVLLWSACYHSLKSIRKLIRPIYVNLGILLEAVNVAIQDSVGR